jgi:hypothetical protein
MSNKDTPKSRQQQRRNEDLWAARTVEWPMSLSVLHYQNLLQQAGVDAQQHPTYFSGFMNRVLNANNNDRTVSTDTTLVQLPPPSCVAAANGWMIAVIQQNNHCLLSRWNVRRGTCDPWMLVTANIYKVFTDPTAHHTLLSAVNGDLYYWHSSYKQKVVPIQGFGSHTAEASMTVRRDEARSYITAAAWDTEHGTEGSSKAILLGTSAGEVYEYALSPTTTTTEPRLVHRFPDPVTGLTMESLRTGRLILAVTCAPKRHVRLYSFVSKSSVSLATILASEQTSLLEFPCHVSTVELHTCKDQLAFLTASGIYYGTMDRTAGRLIDAGMVPIKQAVSLALTPYHWIVLNKTNGDVVIYNRISQSVIQTMEGGVELIKDIRRPDQVWLRQPKGIVHISSSQEDRDVWKFTLQRCLTVNISKHGPASTRLTTRKHTPELTEEEKAQEALFEQAKTLCTNANQKAVVTAVRAEYHLSQGRAELAAKYFAQCPTSLEPFCDTAIRLALPKLGIDSLTTSGKARVSLAASNMPLIEYLSDKMRIGTMDDDKMTSTMIGAWLTELYLQERSDRFNDASVVAEENRTFKDVEASQRALLARFLNSNVNNMDAKTIMKILTSHDVGAVECAVYAARSGDISTAVNAAISLCSDDVVSSIEFMSQLRNCHLTYEVFVRLIIRPMELTKPCRYSTMPRLNLQSLFTTNTLQFSLLAPHRLQARAFFDDTHRVLVRCVCYHHLSTMNKHDQNEAEFVRLLLPLPHLLSKPWKV